MKSITSILLMTLVLLSLTLTCANQTANPNFIIIFCDDLGYGDIGCFGSTLHRTPNIDTIAENGMRLTNFYVTSGVCTPSRSSLMTGCYPRRVNMHEDHQGHCVLFPVGRKGLHPDEDTIADKLKQLGYATACIGKWHLGDQPDFLPTRQGFDMYYGIPYSNDMGGSVQSNRPPLPLLEDETVIEAPVDQNTITRRYTEKAIQFITENKDKPFFLYLPHTMPHNPVHASALFRGKSANEGYGDAVEEIDWSTGEILKTLRDLDLEEKTLVLFTSDNGAAKKWGGNNGPLRGWKGSTWEGGQRVPCVVQWKGKIGKKRESDQLCSTLDLLPTLVTLTGGTGGEHIDGYDISSILFDENAESPRTTFYFYQMDQLQAVRYVNWKLHLPLEDKKRNWGPGEGPQKMQLYDLSKDIGESNNVADQFPEIVKELLKVAENARSDIGDEDLKGTKQRAAGWVDEPDPLLMP